MLLLCDFYLIYWLFQTCVSCFLCRKVVEDIFNIIYDSLIHKVLLCMIIYKLVTTKMHKGIYLFTIKIREGITWITLVSLSFLFRFTSYVSYGNNWQNMSHGRLWVWQCYTEAYLTPNTLELVNKFYRLHAVTQLIQKN